MFFFQDAHELFHVLTETVDEETRDRAVTLTSCDVKSFMVSCFKVGLVRIALLFLYSSER